MLVAAGGTAVAAAPAKHSGQTNISSLNGQAWQLAMAARAENAGCDSSAPGKVRCYIKVLKAKNGPVFASKCVAKEKSGYDACNVQSAYGLKTLSTSKGAGETVGVVDAYDDPNAESDLAVYRKANGLSKCGTGCFEKVNESGVQGSYPPGNMGDGQETSLDIDMVSAICPKCHIILVEATTNSFNDMMTSIDTAISLGANVVSDSWGAGEFDGETDFDSYVDQPGVAITFSSGDGAYGGGVQYPSASPYVTSVGGTMLTPKSNARGWKETAWVTKPSGGGDPTQGSGSGCSQYEAKPTWQTDSGCSNRMTADVSAVAADVLSYDTFETGGGGWYFSFGTSVSSPIVAGIYALAGNSSSVTTPASIPYAKVSDLYDIKKGSEGTCTPAYFCTAGPGYDGPTGLGSPNGDGAF
jgi:subtilase family serine protease